MSSLPFVQLTSLQSLQMSQFKSFNVQPIFSIFFKAEIGTVETGMDPIFEKLVQFYESNRVSQNAQTRKSQIHGYIICLQQIKIGILSSQNEIRNCQLIIIIILYIKIIL